MAAAGSNYAAMVALLLEVGASDALSTTADAAHYHYRYHYQ